MIGVPHEDGSVDYLLLGLWGGAREQAMWRWRETVPDFAGDGSFTPDFHRLQIEYWLHEHRDQLQGRVMDVGQPFRRSLAGPGYFTLGPGCEVEGDITQLALVDNALDAVICTEVLEHCVDPFAAMRELYRALAPGGLLLLTSPFLWPDHHTPMYDDYFRFTAQGWALLTRQFRDVQIVRCEWTAEGAAAFDALRRWEGMGFAGWVEGASGYLVAGVK